MSRLTRGKCFCYFPGTNSFLRETQSTDLLGKRFSGKLETFVLRSLGNWL